MSAAESARRLQVRVHTADRKGAGTDAKVFLKLRDTSGNETRLFLLDNLRVNDHERDTVSEFQLRGVPEDVLGDLDSIVLFRNDSGQDDSWRVDLVELQTRSKGGNCSPCTPRLFPVHRWLRPFTEYRLREFDSSLAQHDDADMRQRRASELAEKRQQYQYAQPIPGGPVQIKILPEDEKFSEKYQFGFGKEREVLMVKTEPIGITEDKWTSFEEMMELVKSTIGAPDGMRHWRSDKWFGIQRLQGVNPVLIKRCTKIPDNLNVDDAMLGPFLEGRSLEQAIQDNKLFMVDLGIVEGIPPKTGTQLCAPIALFYLNTAGDLMPVAIQMFQHKGADNVVFLPSDPPNLWLLAKMFYNNAEAQHHESLTHLGFTHLMMEGVAICTHRHLSASHPLFRLLAPHFLYLISINVVALQDLIAPGKWIDRVMTIRSAGMQELVKRGLKNWRLDQDGAIPAQVEARGVQDPDVLPYYPYRDDAVELYGIIRRYVKTVVEAVYSESGSLQADTELQQWRRELTTEIASGGVGMRGVAGDDVNGFTAVEQVVDVVTAVISVCSQGHAAANFGQYDEYGFVPNYPPVLFGPVPSSKETEPTEQHLLQYLPGRFSTREIMVITKLLSFRGTNVLADFEVRYVYDPEGSQAAETLRQELRDLQQRIDTRNAAAEFPYKWQSPAVVPNAISV